MSFSSLEITLSSLISNAYRVYMVWCGIMVKARCFGSREVPLRGFESIRRNYGPQANSQLNCSSFRGR